jgi:hypothetical protein
MYSRTVSGCVKWRGKLEHKLLPQFRRVEVAQNQRDQRHCRPKQNAAIQRNRPKEVAHVEQRQPDKREQRVVREVFKEKVKMSMQWRFIRSPSLEQSREQIRRQGLRELRNQRRGRKLWTEFLPQRIRSDRINRIRL